jgi:polysaccharide pyruvyl transferase CsaB
MGNCFKELAALGTPTKRVVLSGYYGFQNSGDEAVLQSILLALQEQGERQGVHIVPVVLSINPELTSQTYGVESAHRFRFSEVWNALKEADGLISGGGSLLQDETGWKTIPYYLAVLKLAQWLGKPTFIYSQGIGPVHRPMFFGWIKSVFRKCDIVSVRDEESRNLLHRMGVEASIVRVVPDPVMGMPLRKEPTQKLPSISNRVIGVSVRFWNEDRSELDAIADALNVILAQTDAHIRFLPFHLPSDEAASVYVREKLGESYQGRVTIAEQVTHPQDMLAEVQACDVLIGMRLHSLIYAAGQYVPMIGVSYDPKIDQFLNRLGMKAAFSTKQPDAGALSTQTMALLQNAEQWMGDKKQVIDRLKKEAQRPAELIASFYARG